MERAADYRIDLRRWPVEADTAITAGLPPYTAVDGTYVAGKALPIAFARLKVAKFDQTVPVTATDKAISFTVNLPRGPNRSPDMVPGRQRKPADGRVLRARQTSLVA